MGQICTCSSYYYILVLIPLIIHACVIILEISLYKNGFHEHLWEDLKIWCFNCTRISTMVSHIIFGILLHQCKHILSVIVAVTLCVITYLHFVPAIVFFETHIFFKR